MISKHDILTKTHKEFLITRFTHIQFLTLIQLHIANQVLINTGMGSEADVLNALSNIGKVKEIYEVHSMYNVVVRLKLLHTKH